MHTNKKFSWQSFDKILTDLNGNGLQYVITVKPHQSLKLPYIQSVNPKFFPGLAGRGAEK